MDSSLKKAISVSGSGAALARKLDLGKCAVNRWRVIPWGRLPCVADATGLSILTLRPELRDALLKHDAGRLRQWEAENK